MGLCTWGAASIGNISHRTIAAQLAENITEKTTIEEAATTLAGIVEPKVKKEKVKFVGYYLGGWNPESHEPACFHLQITQDISKKEPLSLGLCRFSGNPMFFTRVFKGYDPQLRTNLLQELKSSFSGTLPVNFDSIFEKAFEKVSVPLLTVGFRDLPIREAIDFVYSYLHLTIKVEKYKFGPPTCGGPIEVAFISTDRLFRWVSHKPFYSAIIEEESEYGI
jgi:hypothetical protein